MMMKRTVWIMLWMLFAGEIAAQVPMTILHRDTVKAKNAITNKSSVYLPDSLISDTLKYEYSRIKNAAYKTKLTKELYKMIFINPKPGRVNVMRTENSEARFEAFAGKTIKNITVVVLPPYGSSVYDTTMMEDLGGLKVLANKIHQRTAERIVRKQITLKPGMQLLPFELVQNEILLRDLSYIDDATILVQEVESDSSEVDLTIICKDEFSWGGEVNSNFLNSAIVQLESKNFMRLGHVVSYEFSYRGTKDKKWGNMVDYRINSLLGTHVDFRGYYKNDYRTKIVQVELNRPFLTSNIKWAGGVAFNRTYYSDNLPDLNMIHPDVPFNYYSPDVWLGKSFLLKSKYSYNQNLYVTGRFFKTIFVDRPEVTPDTNHFYYNRNNYFASFIYTKIKYYKANLIYDFGRTEDVPTGFYSAFTAGFEKNEFQNAGYVGYECRYSHFNKYTERFYSFDAALGSYINHSGFERGLFKLGLHHISNLCSLGSFKYRFYNDIYYITGIRRYPDDYLYFRENNIRGFDSDTLRGNQKLSISLATTLFLPFIKKGFRMSITSFVDGGAIAPNNESIFHSKTYWGVGLKLNIRNDNVVFKNISLRLAYYPSVPGDMRHIEASMSGNQQTGFYDYRIHKPQVILYE